MQYKGPTWSSLCSTEMQQEVTMQATAVLATAPDPTSPATVCVRYEGNQSKRWDGKIVKLDRAWLEEVCGQELLVGTAVEMPWKCKGGKTELWKGVVVSDEPEEQLHHGKKKGKPKLLLLVQSFTVQ